MINHKAIVRSVMFAAIGTFCLALVIFFNWFPVKHALFGKEGIAVVDSVESRTCRVGKRRTGACYIHDLTVDGRASRTQLMERLPVGTQFYVTYIPGKDGSYSSLSPGRKESSLKYLWKNVDLFLLLLFAAGTFFCYALALASFRDRHKTEQEILN